MALELSQETVWFDKWRYDDAEANYHEQKSTLSEGNCGCQDSKLKESLHASVAPQLASLAHQIARAREDIKSSRAASGSHVPMPAVASADIINRVTKLEGENASLRNTVKSLEQSLSEIIKRLSTLECGATERTSTTAAKTTKPEPIEDDDEEVNLFSSGEEEEDADAARVREERLKAYADKKSKKTGPIAKSSVLLDCKPWDDETDLNIMEAEIRKIKMDGLVWGAAKQVPLAFGIHKLSILCTVEDEKVSIDELSEKIQEIDAYVQSVDIAAFNKI